MSVKMTQLEKVASKIIREDPSIEIVLGGKPSSKKVKFLYEAPSKTTTASLAS